VHASHCAASASRAEHALNWCVVPAQHTMCTDGHASSDAHARWCGTCRAHSAPVCFNALLQMDAEMEQRALQAGYESDRERQEEVRKERYRWQDSLSVLARE